jgi:hypothetical protein
MFVVVAFNIVSRSRFPTDHGRSTRCIALREGGSKNNVSGIRTYGKRIETYARPAAHFSRPRT